MPERTRPAGAPAAGSRGEARAALPAALDVHRSLFEHAVNGLAFHEVVVDGDGRPIDYVFLDANPAFERQTGLRREAIVGRRVTEVLPGIERDPADWGPSAVQRRRVLLVEDNLDAAETLREVLLAWEHEVEVAHDGWEGLEKARAFRPDVVLCDIGLPLMDGYEVARAIRADQALASTFLVAVTGYALPEDQRRAAEAGFDRHLGKPVAMELVEEVLAAAPPRALPASGGGGEPRR